MANFYATYSAAAISGTATVNATQGTTPWIVAGQGTAGTAATGVVTVQGITSGTPVPISGSITATNPSVSTTGSAVPASATMVGGTDGTNLRAVKVSTAGVVSVDGSASTQPVSGTVAVSNFPATQPVSGTVAATQSGGWTVTANAGTNLNTSALALDASVVALQVSQGSTTSGQKGALTLGAVTTAAPTYTTAQSSPLSLTTGGALRVDASASTQPVSGTVTANAGTGTFTTDQVATTVATFQDGSIAFGSLTTNFQTVITTGGALRNVAMRNNTNAVIVISLDGGSTTSYTLDPSDQIILDLKTLGVKISTSVTLQAKYSGSAPTVGSIRINGVY